MTQQVASLPDCTGKHLSASSQYYLRRCLGAGGFGAVYLAEQRVLGQPMRDVALKITRASGIRPDQVQAVFGEALTLLRLLHSSRQVEGRLNLVAVYDLGVLEQLGHRGYIAMEYVRGASLRDLLHGRKVPAGGPAGLPKALALDYALQACAGLAVAHRLEPPIVHGDLKPENLLFDRTSGLVKVSDFGLSSQVNALIGQAEVLGRTPAYAAPEVFLGRSTCSSDVYSLGLILYEMLTGTSLFGGVGARGALSGPLLSNAHLEAREKARIPPPSRRISEPAPDEPLDALVQKCLSADDRDRYPSAAELQADLVRYRAGEPLVGPFPAALQPAGPLPRVDERPWIVERARGLIAAGRCLEAAVQLAEGLAAWSGEPDRLGVEMRMLLGEAQLGAGNPRDAAEALEGALRFESRSQLLGSGARRRLNFLAADAHRRLGNTALADGYEQAARGWAEPGPG